MFACVPCLLLKPTNHFMPADSGMGSVSPRYRTRLARHHLFKLENKSSTHLLLKLNAATSNLYMERIFECNKRPLRKRLTKTTQPFEHAPLKLPKKKNTDSHPVQIRLTQTVVSCARPQLPSKVCLHKPEWQLVPNALCCCRLLCARRKMRICT